MKEKAVVVRSFNRRDPVLINPLSPFTRQRIEEGLGGEITADHDEFGFRYRITFPDNPYGASIIKRVGSYGMENDDWELAVTYDGHLYYDSPITGDAVFYLPEEELIDILAQIRNLNSSPYGEIQ